jgi:allantoinase
LPVLAQAKVQGLAITVETCPHDLTFAAEEIPDSATEYKCAPPIRGRENRERLWRALGEGWIDLIASDHSPCPAELKRGCEGDFQKAWGRIASLERSLPAVWTEARHCGYTPPDLARWMSAAPADLAGFGARKGAIAPRYDADLVLWDAEGERDARAEDLHHRHTLTPYAGRRLAGVVQATYLRGVKKMYDRMENSFPAGPAGKILRPSSDEQTEAVRRGSR